ncbi:restriction endonuclease subunit S [Stutzerimonas balearica]|uniref:restriction endonuclease subunit S n=1 Tax=Stutzerimonas balearica TaxID=74829 RepID=UPI00190B88B6
MQLQEFGTWGSGGTPSKGNGAYYQGDVPWAVIGDLNDGLLTETANKISEAGLANSSAKLIPAETLLIAMYGSIGKLAITGIECCTNQAIAFCKIEDSIADKKYLFYALRWARPELVKLGQGASQQNISQTILKSFEVPLSPRAEQTRIAAKLDELLAQVDTLKARIDGIPALLKRFRQSVLAAAVSGQLTEEWRGAVNAADWSLTSLGAIAKRLHQGINTSADKVEYSDSGVPILQAKHITSGKIVIADARLVNAELFEKYKEKYCPPSGSILFTNIGTIGRSVVAGNSANYLIAWNIFLIEPSHNVVPEYLRMFLELLRLQGYYESLYRGGATQFVNKKQLSAIEISLPPVEEQTEIVRRVEQLFAFADQLEARVKAAQTRIDRLTQSILAKAFRGELVPQDPNDEPASVLLERIKAQRAAAPKAKRGRRAATPS